MGEGGTGRVRVKKGALRSPPQQNAVQPLFHGSEMSAEGAHSREQGAVRVFMDLK
jgi:hypothetical protein